MAIRKKFPWKTTKEGLIMLGWINHLSSSYQSSFMSGDYKDINMTEKAKYILEIIQEKYPEGPAFYKKVMGVSLDYKVINLRFYNFFTAERRDGTRGYKEHPNKRPIIKKTWNEYTSVKTKLRKPKTHELVVSAGDEIKIRVS